MGGAENATYMPGYTVLLQSYLFIRVAYPGLYPPTCLPRLCDYLTRSIRTHACVACRMSVRAHAPASCVCVCVCVRVRVRYSCCL